MTLGNEDVSIRQGKKLHVDLEVFCYLRQKISVMLGEPLSQISNCQGEVPMASVPERAQKNAEPINHLRIDRADHLANDVWLWTAGFLWLRRVLHPSAISLAFQGPPRDLLG